MAQSSLNLSLSLSRRSFSRQALVPGGALDSGRDLKRTEGNKKPRQIMLVDSRATELVLKFVIAPSICDVDTIHFPVTLC